jgi:uncharacterized damage-inducible protein DinB
MDHQEKQEMLAELEKGRRELLEALRGVTEEAAASCPAPGRWSVLECVEHVAAVEDYLFGQIGASSAAAAPSADRRREKLIPVRAADRRFRVEAPDVAKPAGRFATLEAATARFLAGRERTLHFVEECSDDLRARLTTHPILGTVNCWETLLLMAAHPIRHVAQIREALGEGVTARRGGGDFPSL